MAVLSDVRQRRNPNAVADDRTSLKFTEPPRFAILSVMNCKTMLLASALSIMPLAALADIADVFRQYDQGTVADKNFVKTLIVGIADGLGAANDQLQETGKPMLYCSPASIKFTGDQLIDILRRWVEANRAKAPRIDTAPPAMTLLYALKDAFPCPKSN